MKKILKYFLQYYLKYLTKFILIIHKPLIIGIAGSVNKHFYKEDIKNILLKSGFTVRANPKNFNTEIGLPLAILNLNSGYNSYQAWLPILYSSIKVVFQKKFPHILVLELGTSDPGDMNYLLSIVSPKIVVLTDITQRYLESFSDMNKLVEEYLKLTEKTPKDGLLIYNMDNNRIRSIAQTAKCKTISLGRAGGSDWQIINSIKTNNGQNIFVRNDGVNKQLSINKFGEHHQYSTIASLIINEYVSATKK